MKSLLLYCNDACTKLGLYVAKLKVAVAESAPQADAICLRYSYNSRPTLQLILERCASRGSLGDS